ncbi:hypothetical protein CSC2_00520 [Clostridium zeae]|uniref:Lipoprotein n=1 Tax=Clostridium zeae TaxID=2759022 RepID=A0ABQ1E457_9CLOT|nr:hypothetical protein [Clostridium zeae]GFZ29526.1 hypothetical protein CSC2_00520 [Clostridium zeae]
MGKKVFTLLVTSLAIILTSCSVSSSFKNSPPTYSYSSKTAIEEKEDGWLYFFSYEYSNNNKDSNKSYIFNGYNLKYKHISGYDIPIIDGKTKKVVDTATSSLPYLTLNKEFDEDITNIKKTLIEKQFVTPIEISDLDSLNLKKIQKDNVLKLFNEAMEKKELPNGKYDYLPEANVIQENLLSGYQWQVGYFMAKGNILAVRIELIYDKTKYLSDMIKDNTADSLQKDVYNKIKEIEKQIIDKQSFQISGYEKLTFDKIQFKRLQELLKKIESEGKTD